MYKKRIKYIFYNIALICNKVIHISVDACGVVCATTGDFIVL